MSTIIVTTVKIKKEALEYELVKEANRLNISLSYMVLYFLVATVTKFIYLLYSIDLTTTLENIYLLKPITDYLIFDGFSRPTKRSTLINDLHSLE